MRVAAWAITLPTPASKNQAAPCGAARERKGWTLEQPADELWDCGLPTSQNRLWRLENNPPPRLATELLLWLEKVPDEQLISASRKKQVLINDVVAPIDSFLEARPGAVPAHSATTH